MTPCPICSKGVAPRTENPQHPFCSTRCKAVDLGRWLSEAYSVPGEPAPEGATGLQEETS